jgi:hypothetical protein
MGMASLANDFIVVSMRAVPAQLTWLQDFQLGGPLFSIGGLLCHKSAVSGV